MDAEPFNPPPSPGITLMNGNDPVGQLMVYLGDPASGSWLVVTGKNGELLFEVKANGKMEYGPAYTPEAAEAAFLEVFSTVFSTG